MDRSKDSPSRPKIHPKKQRSVLTSKGSNRYTSKQYSQPPPSRGTKTGRPLRKRRKVYSPNALGGVRISWQCAECGFTYFGAKEAICDVCGMLSAWTQVQLDNVPLDGEWKVALKTDAVISMVLRRHHTDASDPDIKLETGVVYLEVKAGDTLGVCVDSSTSDGAWLGAKGTWVRDGEAVTLTMTRICEMGESICLRHLLVRKGALSGAIHARLQTLNEIEMHVADTLLYFTRAEAGSGGE